MNVFHLRARQPWASIALALSETPEELCGSGNATRASVLIVVGLKWVKFQFRLNFAFRQGAPDCNHCRPRRPERGRLQVLRFR